MLREWPQLLTTTVFRLCSDWVIDAILESVGSHHWSLWFPLPYFILQLVGPFSFNPLDISTGRPFKPPSINPAMLGLVGPAGLAQGSLNARESLPQVWVILNNAITKLTFESYFHQTRVRKLKLLWLRTDEMMVLKSLRLLDLDSRVEDTHWNSHHDPGDDIGENTPPKKSNSLLSPGTY